MTTLTTYKTAASSDRAAIIRIMKGLNELGWQTYAYHDSEERHPLLKESPATCADRVAETDIATIYIRKETSDPKAPHRASLFFVLGNSPWEVMADCSMSDAFDPDLKAVEDAINLEGCHA